MGRKDRKYTPDEPRDAADYYRLNHQAVDDLVNATPENSPKVSEKELRKYRSGPKIRLRDWMKVVLIKWWFGGAVCFFFYWGLGMVVHSMENQLLILGAALGMITNLLTNNVLRFWRGAPGLLLDVLYGFVILGCIVATYQGLNRLLISLTGAAADSVPLGVEPILFGALAMGWDFLWIGIRRTAGKILADAKSKGQPGS